MFMFNLILFTSLNCNTYILHYRQLACKRLIEIRNRDHDKLKNKTLAIIEKRDEYKRDKTWSYWKTVPHKFDDCVKKRWKDYTINFKGKTSIETLLFVIKGQR